MGPAVSRGTAAAAAACQLMFPPLPLPLKLPLPRPLLPRGAPAEHSPVERRPLLLPSPELPAPAPCTCSLLPAPSVMSLLLLLLLPPLISALRALLGVLLLVLPGLL